MFIMFLDAFYKLWLKNRIFIFFTSSQKNQQVALHIIPEDCLNLVTFCGNLFMNRFVFYREYYYKCFHDCSAHCWSCYWMERQVRNEIYMVSYHVIRSVSTNNNKSKKL